MATKSGGSMGKPGGGHKPGPDRPKYDGPTINVASMDGASDELYMTLKYVGTRASPHYNYPMRKRGVEPMGVLVIGRDRNYLINKTCSGAPLTWDAVNGWGEDHPDQREAVDAFLAYVEALA
ncbi:MAG: hypothetical protein IT519_16775 [Burkholderiales bacterium]|nr:hypothetical protein [Burkholderiales bacterium]